MGEPTSRDLVVSLDVRVGTYLEGPCPSCDKGKLKQSQIEETRDQYGTRKSVTEVIASAIRTTSAVRSYYAMPVMLSAVVRRLRWPVLPSETIGRAYDMQASSLYTNGFYSYPEHVTRTYQLSACEFYDETGFTMSSHYP